MELSVYRLDRVHSLVVLGRFAVGTGILVAAAAVVAAVVDTIPTVLVWALGLLLGVALLLTALAALRALRPPAVLSLDAAGYRLGVLRGAGPVTVRWDEVQRVRRQRLAPGECLVLVLSDERRTVLPVRLLEGGAATAARLDADLRARLDRAHGQRRFGARGGGGGGI